ncbi:hypothetical protein R1flu_019904 [Riccia fluitans]|uniref:Secreted protein n=1 Tax=Riccia fluitans TaxID=41844 RepID=A0ABD1ZLL3_9MARC
MCCSGGEGCFAQAWLACFAVSLATGRDICECNIPCFGYMKYPGLESCQFLCFGRSQSQSPPPQKIHRNSWCSCTLCLCGFRFGDFLDPQVTSSSATITSEKEIKIAPVLQIASRES